MHPPEVDLNLFKHLSNLYISLNLDEFDYHVFPSLDAMVSRCKHGERTKELVPKSHFLDLDEEFENVNKGGQIVNNHVEL